MKNGLNSKQYSRNDDMNERAYMTPFKVQELDLFIFLPGLVTSTSADIMAGRRVRLRDGLS